MEKAKSSTRCPAAVLFHTACSLFHCLKSAIAPPKFCVLNQCGTVRCFCSSIQHEMRETRHRTLVTGQIYRVGIWLEAFSLSIVTPFSCITLSGNSYIGSSLLNKTRESFLCEATLLWCLRGHTTHVKKSCGQAKKTLPSLVMSKSVLVIERKRRNQAHTVLFHAACYYFLI